MENALERESGGITTNWRKWWRLLFASWLFASRNSLFKYIYLFIIGFDCSSHLSKVSRNIELRVTSRYICPLSSATLIAAVLLRYLKQQLQIWLCVRDIQAHRSIVYERCLTLIRITVMRNRVVMSRSMLDIGSETTDASKWWSKKKMDLSTRKGTIGRTLGADAGGDGNGTTVFKKSCREQVLWSITRSHHRLIIYTRSPFKAASRRVP